MTLADGLYTLRATNGMYATGHNEVDAQVTLSHQESLTIGRQIWAITLLKDEIAPNGTYKIALWVGPSSFGGQMAPSPKDHAGSKDKPIITSKTEQRWTISEVGDEAEGLYTISIPSGTVVSNQVVGTNDLDVVLKEVFILADVAQGTKPTWTFHKIF